MDGICQTNVDDDKSVECVKTDKLFFVFKPTKKCLCTYQEKTRMANLLMSMAV
jgi:hypothetical protein